MKAIFNDTKKKTLSVIDVKPSKREYCKILDCQYCCKDKRYIAGKPAGLIQNADYDSNAKISGNNIDNNPELVGSFIMLGINENNRLRGLTDDEIEFFMNCFGPCAGGGYVLWGIEFY